MTTSRRAFLASTPATLSLAWWPAHAASDEVVFDFQGRWPPGVRFERASPAVALSPESVARSAVAGSGLRTVAQDQARTSKEGVLIEGALRNRISAKARWEVVAGASVRAATETAAPDGGQDGVQVLSLPKLPPAPDAASSAAKAAAKVEPPGGHIKFNASEGWGTASVWLRAEAPRALRLRVMDFKTYQQASVRVEVGPQWQRFDVSTVFLNEPGQAAESMKILSILPVRPTAEDRVKKGDATQASGASAVWVWGPQYEPDNGPTSWVATSREADTVLMPASPLNRASGQLTLALPQGGRRDAVLIDAQGEAKGLRIEYSPSGWLVARISGVVLSGIGAATDARFVRLAWTPEGAQLSSAKTEQAWVPEAVWHGTLPAPQCGSEARLGMSAQGTRPLGRLLALVRVSPPPAALVRTVARPSFVPQRHVLTFEDDFDDTDLSRLNENAKGGKPGAPAWRSRYRHERNVIINGEKQTYMDPAYKGASPEPLGVQPFSIANSILTIRAEPAHPERVKPFIGKQRYTSGCITSEYTHDQKYGYFEISARMPRGRGFWPAFWLLPQRKAWPPEIDVFEGSGHKPLAVHLAFHEKDRSKSRGRWVDAGIDTTDGFHRYAVEWTQDDIKFFVDGKQHFASGAHGIHEPMYLLANLAIGSETPGWIPNPDSSTPWPGELEIDYIRAYQRG